MIENWKNIMWITPFIVYTGDTELQDVKMVQLTTKQEIFIGHVEGQVHFNFLIYISQPACNYKIKVDWSFL